MIWRKTSRILANAVDRGQAEAAVGPLLCCRHCGNVRVKLTYRRYDDASTGERGLTLIYRCTSCDQFTTVRS